MTLDKRTSTDRTAGDGVTAAALGDMYDMSDGAKPIQEGGGYEIIVSGDTWYSTWGRDDTAYLIHDDGWGFDNIGGANARHRLCRLDGNPNVATDGFRGVNLNPGLLGKTMPHWETSPEWRIGYSSSVHERDGVLYIVRHNWSPELTLWPPIDSSIIKSTDGGRNWVNHLGQVNAELPDRAHAMFPCLPWSWLTFIEYGKGGIVPNVDNAEQYVYLTAAAAHLARVPRGKLADLNRQDFQYYLGNGLDGMLDSSWSSEMADGKPMRSVVGPDGERPGEEDGFHLTTVLYNFALKRYIGLGSSKYFAQSEAVGHDAGKTRILIYAAERPWGPWRRILNYGIWGIAGWDQLLCNKYTTADGRKLWFTFCGEYKGDTWSYSFQYSPVYLSTGPVDVYEAERSTLTGPRVGGTYPSHSGSGYIEGFTKRGDKATFAIDRVNGTGWHIVRIRYTSPKANANTLSVYVNGRKARRVKLSLNNSDFTPGHNWIDRSDIYYLNQGANTFELRQDEGDDGTGVLIDYIAVSREATHDEGRNVAPEAVATASSGEAGNAVKGCVDGWREWVAKGTAGEWIDLDWGASARTVEKVVLYDRVSMEDQVTAGTLSFSDGSSMPIGKLQNDGQAGTVVTFPPKDVSWVKFTVDVVREGTKHAGLGEMQVFALRDEW